MNGNKGVFVSDHAGFFHPHIIFYYVFDVEKILFWKIIQSFS